MTKISDGFRLSEEDLKLRGPGEVMGLMQHGTPEFKAGHLIQDARIIQQARYAADALLKTDARLTCLNTARSKKQSKRSTDPNGRWESPDSGTQGALFSLVGCFLRNGRSFLFCHLLPKLFPRSA